MSFNQLHGLTVTPATIADGADQMHEIRWATKAETDLKYRKYCSVHGGHL